MPTITLSVSDVTKDASKTTIADGTTYTSPARSEYYSVFHALKVDESDVESAAVVLSQGIATSASSWDVTTPVDGHYRFKLLLYWTWEGTTTFEIGDVVERNTVFYKAVLQNTNIDPEVNGGGEWAVHVSSSDDDAETLVESGVYDCILFFRLKTCFAKEVALAADIACGCAVDKKPAEIQRYERKGLMIDGIAVDNYQNRFSAGETKVLYMSKLCPNCN